MTEMTRYAPGMFCWAELATSDWKAATKFYGALFGWSTEEMPMGDQPPYVMLKKNGKNVAALYENPKATPGWLPYISVVSADDASKKAKSLGATLLGDPFDVFDAGRMANVKDPEGNRFALWQAKKHPGAKLINEPDTMCWNELYSTKLDALRKFYTALFGWKLNVSPEYTEIHVGETPVGGMLEMPPMKGWFPYFQVESCGATVKTAKKLGAKVHVEKELEHVGRFAFFGDPQGATFAVIELKQRT